MKNSDIYHHSVYAEKVETIIKNRIQQLREKAANRKIIVDKILSKPKKT
jgi:hypothetical protein